MGEADAASLGRALLFDVDGVLLDGQSVYETSWETWAVARGLDPVVVTAAMHGRRPAETIAEVAPHLNVAVELSALATTLARVAPIPAMPGARPLLQALAPGRWTIVTSSSEWHVRRCFGAAGLPLPSASIFADDVRRGKPAPEPYLMAAERLAIEPARCVVIEDTPAGIASGKAAGCAVLAVATTHAAGELAEADEVFPSLVAATPRLLDLGRARGSTERGPRTPVAYMLCGLPGAGKTSAALQLVQQGCERFSVDQVMHERHGRQDTDFPSSDYLRLHAEVVAELDQRLVELLDAGRDVVLDYGLEFWTAASRERYKCLIESCGARWELIYLQANRTLLRRRLVERNRRTDADAFFVTDERLDAFIAQFEEPRDEMEIVRPQRTAANG